MKCVLSFMAGATITLVVVVGLSCVAVTKPMREPDTR